ncbi:MAG TPA: hypothetical protein VFH60_01710, partial [Chloroflexia bacterium]|nr:hypothetical protein [Chloroflexia bacterium]
MRKSVRIIGILVTLSMLLSLAPAGQPLGQAGVVDAATPADGTLNPPNSQVTWTGGPYTVVTPDPALCSDSSTNCDTFTLNVNLPDNYWETAEGKVTIGITWTGSADFDMYVYNEEGDEVDSSAAGATTYEEVTLPELPGGTYEVRVVAYTAFGTTYNGYARLESTQLPPGMVYPESRDVIMEALTVDYPLNIIFVGYSPTAEEIAEMRQWIPDNYQPTVSSKSPIPDEIQNEAAGLLNWNKNHYINGKPYFLGIRYNYKIRFLQATEEYARALFQQAENSTAPNQSFHTAQVGASLARYDQSYGNYRVVAKGGDPSYKVTDPTKTDLIDAYAMEDWIFNSRYDDLWNCAFRDLETGDLYSAAVIQPGEDAYYDPYYDKNGLNLDRMPQGPNKGSSFLFFDTFMPEYASEYFRPNAYHTWGTDKVINNAIVSKKVEEGGSWRITNPDTGAWDGVDFARTWGGRYRFHFIDLGAAPNDYESSSWAGAERTMSSDYPHGDPPIWQYKADPQWQQSGEACAADDLNPQYEFTGGTPCRMMPRLGRDVAYGLFFRSTSGYLYRPIPRGDVNWLAVSNWTDFYSRPQYDPVTGQITSAPWYGNWWTNTDKLYKIANATDPAATDDVLRWLSSALPYTRWVGRKGEVITVYDPTNNQPTARLLDTSPKYEDLPAPEYHVSSSATDFEMVPEPLYAFHTSPRIVTYGSSQVNLTDLSNAFEKAKARGFVGLTYDFSVPHEYMRDYFDAHRPGIADIVTGTNGISEFSLVNTIPGINMVFEKAYTWALPVIVGGIAVGTDDGEAWGTMNNVNDRAKSPLSDYPANPAANCPAPTRTLEPWNCPKHSTVADPGARSGGGFSYTIEHEAAHNLGLSHPHDGSFGIDRCPEDDPNEARRGKWECYWSGLGWMYDISAAPTTYAMSYRPYEVEDQDNLQRGRIAEYLVLGQDALKQRLIDESNDGNTTPSAGWTSDFNRMKQWRAQAAALFQVGDYLHSEYAARNASLAARGVPQLPGNTSNPKLVEAGQIFYFNVNPQTQPEEIVPCGGGGPGPVLPPCEIQFQDVPPSTDVSSFYPFVRCLACQHILGGYPCGGPGEPCGVTGDPYYRPNANITRGQISKIVSNSARFHEDPGAQLDADVKPGDPFYPWINRLSRRHHMGGYPCGGPGEPCDGSNRPYFRPASNATRGQLSKIVSNAASFNDTPQGQTYTD